MQKTPQYVVPLNYSANHNGPRLPVENRRVFPTDSGNYAMRTDSLTAEIYPTNPQVSYVRLYERSISEFGGKGMLVRDRLSGKALSGTITFPPTLGTFYLNPYMGIIFLHKDDVGKGITCVYQAMGSLIAAEEINYIHTNAYNAAIPWQSGTPHTIASGATMRWEHLIIDAVWEVLPDNSYKGNPNDIEVTVYEAENLDAYYSVLKNTGSSQRVFKVRLIPHVTQPF